MNIKQLRGGGGGCAGAPCGVLHDTLIVVRTQLCCGRGGYVIHVIIKMKGIILFAVSVGVKTDCDHNLLKYRDKDKPFRGRTHHGN